jgi:cobalt-zinc-cadmium efflux system outer membrane protein
MSSRTCIALVPLILLPAAAFAQQSYTWDQIRDKFKSSNPTLKAGEIGIDESKAQEITAYLRPNPDFTAFVDQIDLFSANPYRPLGETFPEISGSYLHERQHKRELRLESSKKGTVVAKSQQLDLERNLVFNLRTAFVNTLQAKAVLSLAKESLDYYDKVLVVSRDRFKAGDIAKVDLTRLELQRVQFESDVETSTVSLRTAKIQLLQLLNERTPIERFDVTGPFDFVEKVQPDEELRQIALDTRPDLRAAVQSVDKAGTDHKLAVANGSTDPTFGIDFARNPPIPVYFGLSMTIPLRIFDRNQGEKLRTQLDIGRTEKLRDAAYAQVFNDVDSAYWTLIGQLNLLRPYKAHYLREAVEVRETISFAYQHGGAALLDFLSAQNDYRSVQRSYLGLIGSYLTAAAQLNLAVGREVIQ